MKRVLCIMLISALILLSLGGCIFSSPKEELYAHLCAFTPEFELYTREDVSGLFRTVLSEHPELQLYVDEVSVSEFYFKRTVKVAYQHTDFPKEKIVTGLQEEVAKGTLCAQLAAAEPMGVMVLTDTPEQPDPQPWLDAAEQEAYLSYMGLKSTGWTFYNNDFTDDTIVICQAEFSIDTEQLLEQRQKTKQEVERLSALLWTAEDGEEARIRAIHDYLIQYANYAKESTPADHMPYNVLLEGRGVCDGYAYAAKLLLDKAGVDNRMVTGSANGGEHRWNLVKIGEEWYHMDITWDDPVSTDGKEHHLYEYYLKSDATMSAEHVWETDLPECTRDYA